MYCSTGKPVIPHNDESLQHNICIKLKWEVLNWEVLFSYEYGLLIWCECYIDTHQFSYHNIFWVLDIRWQMF